MGIPSSDRQLAAADDVHNKKTPKLIEGLPREAPTIPPPSPGYEALAAQMGAGPARDDVEPLAADAVADAAPVSPKDPQLHDTRHSSFVRRREEILGRPPPSNRNGPRSSKKELTEKFTADRKKDPRSE